MALVIPDGPLSLLGGARIGYGEDVHALANDRPLVLGGFKVPDSPLGPIGHSDGDALLHALADALLSAFALGDIGHYFPPSNPNYKGLDSQVILQTVLERLSDHAGEVRVGNVAAVITLDRPKLGPHRVAMQHTLAELLGIEASRIGLVFKTSEGMALGHIQTRVTVLLAAEL
jgi:2-C-methyl-D-erythritol 2,4-cyclodiphosphate synthase